MSSLEKIVYKILSNSSIHFVQEKQFQDLHYGLYRFDFYLPESNTCIELNGAQHYSYTKIFHKNRSDFQKGQERDRRKIAYCLAKGITLYIIPYWDIDSITSLDDIFQEKYIARSKFHNDEAYRHQKSK